MKFEKLNAVVSGGASGLGFATAEHIVKAGGKVALLDVNEEQGHAAANKLGDAAIFLATDVSSETAVKTAVDKAVDSFGRLDVAVSCAGVLSAGRVISRKGPMPSDFFNKAIQVNLVGTFNLCKAAAEKMMENDPREDGERGVLINTASVAAFEGQIGQAAYSASKGGVASMTLPMAREFAKAGIRVVSIAPGIFLTPMMEQLPEEVQQSLGAQIPFPNRMGKPEEFGQMVEAICENINLNGTTIRLDGGIRMQAK
jgi:NAD(P)-dependent dehydrogenase (short-subunit alcohol dehydrogenase family)